MTYLKIRSSRPFFNFFYRKIFVFYGKTFLWACWRIVFLPFSLVYLIFIYLKKIFKSYKIFKPQIISVGNIELGGTGKTPLIIFLTNSLKTRFRSIVVVSYGEKIKDEPILLSENLPGIKIFSGKNKRKIIETIDEKYNPDLILIDDGFNYFDIKKTDIVILDPFLHFDLVLPAGLKRLPYAFLKYSDTIVINHSEFLNEEQKEKIREKYSRYKKPVYFSRYNLVNFIDVKNSVHPLSIIKNKNILLFCGLGKPWYFLKNVKSLKPGHIFFTFYPDHFNYTEFDIQQLEIIIKEKNIDIAITTEKDLIKIKKFSVSFSVYALNIQISFEKEFEVFHKKI
jgi:tetraacyldisaccharide 4'-kinase